jgi:hypothetical protein
MSLPCCCHSAAIDLEVSNAIAIAIVIVFGVVAIGIIAISIAIGIIAIAIGVIAIANWCNSVKLYPCAYSQHLKMLKHFT